MSLINDGESVLMKKGSVIKLVQVRRGRKLVLEKSKFCIDGLLGHAYGSTFEVQNGSLIKINTVDFHKDLEVETECGRDNRNLKDNGVKQKLTRDDIQELKKEFSGSEIVDQLVENSATFREKTEFSQQKYLKKKHSKYRAVFTVLRPTARHLAEMYYNQGPSRICNLRVDSLAQVLERSCVRAGSRFLVCESCLGLITGALLERMAGSGLVVDLHVGNTPSRPALSSMNLSAEQKAIWRSFPIEYLANLDQPINSISDSRPTNVEENEDMIENNEELAEDELKSNENKDDGVGEHMLVEETCQADSTSVGNPASPSSTNKNDAEKQKSERNSRRELRRQQLEQTRLLLNEKNFDGLIVASKCYPTSIVMSLIEFLLPSRPVVIFSAYKEPLVDCYQMLRERKGVIMLTLSETWLRECQVLANRTHPLVNMSGGGGFLLTAINVEK